VATTIDFALHTIFAFSHRRIYSWLIHRMETHQFFNLFFKVRATWTVCPNFIRIANQSFRYFSRLISNNAPNDPFGEWFGLRKSANLACEVAESIFGIRQPRVLVVGKTGGFSTGVVVDHLRSCSDVIELDKSAANSSTQIKKPPERAADEFRQKPRQCGADGTDDKSQDCHFLSVI
jgi:hypothetical protein